MIKTSEVCDLGVLLSSSFHINTSKNDEGNLQKGVVFVPLENF